MEHASNLHATFMDSVKDCVSSDETDAASGMKFVAQPPALGRLRNLFESSPDCANVTVSLFPVPDFQSVRVDGIQVAEGELGEAHPHDLARMAFVHLRQEFVAREVNCFARIQLLESAPRFLPQPFQHGLAFEEKSQGFAHDLTRILVKPRSNFFFDEPIQFRREMDLHGLKVFPS
jgi:hypothetical protein